MGKEADDARQEAKDRKNRMGPGQNSKGKRDTAQSFPMVAIGASAGGLEALEAFLSHVPTDSGVAFFVIQHLDPKHKGMMPELLQRTTKMTVSQARDKERVKPDHVYVIPPSKDMSIMGGTLYLFDFAEDRGLRLPFDHFLRAFAEDQKEYAIAVVLSGMGSDGTLGFRAIKEKGGLTLAQDPTTAKFDSMPRSVIDAGLADMVATPDGMPNRILDYLQRLPSVVKPAQSLNSKSQSSLEKALVLLRVRTAHDFSGYKKSTIYRRIERRMAIHQIGDIKNYTRYLQENGGEVELLFKELLIGVTSFFRDPPAWAYLRDHVLMELAAVRMTEGVLRAWVPGCSTGEEAYSLAMIFKEMLDKLEPRASLRMQIFATDLDADAIDKARLGIYPANVAADVSAERLSRFFLKEDDKYRISKEIREMVVFAVQNVIADPPFTKVDLISCRNLLIYLESSLQQKLLPTFHYSLKPGGVLFLGSAETIGAADDLFAPVRPKLRIYRRVNVSPRVEPAELPRVYERYAADARPAVPESRKADLQTLADRLLLDMYTPAAVLVNASGDIVYIHGKTGRFLEPPTGKANWNIMAMAREGLSGELAVLFQRVVRNKGQAESHNVSVRANGGTILVNVAVSVLEKPDELRGMILVVFAEVPATESKGAKRSRAKSEADQRLKDTESELQNTRETLQMTMEEMQASQEELKSANEELQSTNEELQSTNEELTTSREEMQSLNEELQTVNAELQSKVDQLSKTNDDMENLLNSTEIATLFLDEDFNVRRYTPQAAKIVKLIPRDIGRPLSDLVTELDYPHLYEDAREVLRTLVFSEKKVPTKGGKWYDVRIMPYRTRENRIDGVVITLVDITESKEMERRLLELRQDFDKLKSTR